MENNIQITRQIKEKFLLPPTFQQENVIKKLADFLVCGDEQSAFLLNGYAGTGKTTLISALVGALEALGARVMLLAPTGRAAKVFANHAGRAAFTIHRKIYRQRVLNADGGVFELNDNLHKDTFFIVDEASMIQSVAPASQQFGSNALLYDLVRYVYNGAGCRLLLIGDTAQLPPVGESQAYALDESVLSGLRLHVFSAVLSDVVRQKNGGGILWNATNLRQMVTEGEGYALPKIKFEGFADIINVRGDELIDSLAQSYHDYGLDDTIVITRSNKRANIYNQGIRRTVLDYEDELASGDMLMVAKNNYFWTDKDNFIANGEIAILKRYRRVRELYGFNFADVEIELPDRNNEEINATVLLDTLRSDAPALTAEEQQKLFDAVMEDYFDIAAKQDKLKEMKKNEYFNALQVKYAYAVTCHKAQGGQWSCVYVDQGYMTEEMLSPDYFRWLYTAFTRATEKLYLVNWPKEQVMASPTTD